MADISWQEGPILLWLGAQMCGLSNFQKNGAVEWNKAYGGNERR